MAAVPTLAAIALGELARVFGGGGQGQASGLPWAIAYTGAGPWASLAPATPAHPSQVYDGLAAVLALAVVGVLLRFGALRTRDGSAFFVGVLAWALGRCLVTFTWRDEALFGPVRAGTLIALAVAVAAIGGIVLARLAEGRSRRQAHDRPPPSDQAPDWPDPATRPPF